MSLNPRQHDVAGRLVALAIARSRDDNDATVALLQQIEDLDEALLHVAAAVEMTNTIIEIHGGNPADIFPPIALGYAIEGPEGDLK